MQQAGTLPTTPMTNQGQALSTFSEFLEFRTFAARAFHLEAEINEETANSFRRISEAMAAELLASDVPVEARVIRVFINSPGGDVVGAFDMITQIRRLQRLGIRFEAIITGEAASSAAAIAAVVDWCAISSLGGIMWHGASGGSDGDSTSLKLTAAELDRIGGHLTDILVARARRVPGKRSRYSRRAVAQAIMPDANEVWIYPTEAFEAGLVDEILA